MCSTQFIVLAYICEDPFASLEMASIPKRKALDLWGSVLKSVHVVIMNSNVCSILDYYRVCHLLIRWRKPLAKLSLSTEMMNSFWKLSSSFAAWGSRTHRCTKP